MASWVPFCPKCWSNFIQRCWMQHFRSVCTSCWTALGFAGSCLDVQIKHSTSSDISFVQVCDGLNVEWANSQLNSPLFHENPASHTFLIRDFPEYRFFFFSKKVQLLPKRINVRCRLAISIYILPFRLYFTFLVNNQLWIHSSSTQGPIQRSRMMRSSATA